MLRKTILPSVILIMAVVISLYAVPQIQKNQTLVREKKLAVILVYQPQYRQKMPQILAAYESVLQEEGVPFQSVDVFQLVATNVNALSKRIPALILPDGLLQNTPGQFSEWLKSYLALGGNVAVIYNAGIKNPKGLFLKRSSFADIIGLNYITFHKLGKASLDYGYIRFTSEAKRDFFQIPPGKTVQRLTLSGYSYGRLNYPIARNEPLKRIPADHIYAYGITSDQKKYPVITLTDYLKGKVLYVGMPLGYLKANADDLPLRATLRTFLFRVVKMPHLMNVADGRGGIVINWHIDSSIELDNLPKMLKRGFFRKEIPCSFDITAGDFRDRPGDGLGFAAGGRGRDFVKILQEYGTIGSHGGWAHNWFYRNILNGSFSAKNIKDYIVKNNACLEAITGSKIVEYAAPSGVHPQPTTTKILEDLGFIAYYYTGDTGSGPNRTFFKGQMVSDRVIAFPIMPLGRSASLFEMRSLDQKPESAIREWLTSILDYTVRNRTVRLFYSHPYDIDEYPQAVTTFINQVAARQRQKVISAGSMTDFARFFLRFLKTGYSFSIKGRHLVIDLNNPDGLQGITIAVPKQISQKPADHKLTCREDQTYYYLTVVGTNETKKQVILDLR